MRRIPVFSLTAFACLFAILPANLPAADGAIPIWEPTTITEPGHYVITRNISGNLVIAADNVDLDLNGFTISGSSPINATGVSGMKIHDGTVASSDTCLSFADITEFDIRRVVMDSDDCGGLCVFGGGGGVVTDNLLKSQAGGGSDNHILLMDVDAVHVVGNRTVEVPGGEINVTGSRNLVQNNIMGAIKVTGSDNMLLGNSVSGGTGIWVDGSRNHIEGNLGTNSATRYGLRFVSGSTDNLFRNNTMRGNSGTGCTGVSSGGDFCDEGTNNTSHGDNYMPGQM